MQFVVKAALAAIAAAEDYPMHQAKSGIWQAQPQCAGSALSI